MCVQRRLACPVVVSPTEVKVRSLVVGMTDFRETESLKLIDNTIFGMVDESPGCSENERIGGLESEKPRRPSLQPEGEGSTDGHTLTDVAEPLRRGGSDGMVARTR